MPRARHLDWTLWAWGVLAHAGQTAPDRSEWPDVENVIAFAALAGAFTSFANILGDAPEDEPECPELLSGPFPPMTETDLGRYCERHGIYTGEVPESSDELLDLAIGERSGEVLAELRGLVGNAACYASIRQAVEGPAVWAEDEDEEIGLPLSWQRDPGLWANGTDDGLACNRWAPNLSVHEVGLAVNTGLSDAHHAAYAWLNSVKASVTAPTPSTGKSRSCR